MAIQDKTPESVDKEKNKDLSEEEKLVIEELTLK
jgi:hypothetical protein